MRKIVLLNAAAAGAQGHEDKGPKSSPKAGSFVKFINCINNIKKTTDSSVLAALITGGLSI